MTAQQMLFGAPSHVASSADLTPWHTMINRQVYLEGGDVHFLLATAHAHAHLLDLGAQPLPQLQASMCHQHAAIRHKADCCNVCWGRTVKPAHMWQDIRCKAASSTCSCICSFAFDRGTMRDLCWPNCPSRARSCTLRYISTVLTAFRIFHSGPLSQMRVLRHVLLNEVRINHSNLPS